MRNYPERITAKRMIAEKRMEKLSEISKTPYPYQDPHNAKMTAKF